MRNPLKQCEFVNKDGIRCRGYKITNSKYCFTHSDDPEIAVMRERALQKAANSHKLYLPIEGQEGEVALTLPKFVDLSKARGIRRAYITIIRAAAQGGLEEKKLGALVYAMNGYVNAIDKIELLERIEALEKILKERGLLNG